jgi:asparagine synthetase B (glutamine-hydrolysing)
MRFCPSPFELSPLELASGLVFGMEPSVEIPEDEVPDDPLVGLEQAILPALLRDPCVVSFSGGRDSSAVLAVATALARREGLPAPVPATNVFPDAPRSDERASQELVIAHLGLDDWVRVELRDELDCVGPLALSILQRHGLLWPFNAHFHHPLLAVARDGTLLTGIGGDELLGTSQWARAALVLAGGVRPVPRDVVRVLLAVAPHGVRREVLRRRWSNTPWLPWLTEAANAELLKASAAELAAEPLRWSSRWAWWRRRRETSVGIQSLERVAADCHAAIEHPLTAHSFVASAGRLASRRHVYDRASAMRALFSKVLPARIVERESKAAFGAVFWGRHSRSFGPAAVETAAELETVDANALRTLWATEAPDAHSFLLLQAAALRLAPAHPD